MRLVVLLLIAANLAFFAFARLDAAGGREGARMSEQIDPAKIRLLTPRDMAALGPAKVAALADVCLEWGPLSETDRARALSDLEPLQLGKLLTQRKSETSNMFWVYLPPVQNHADADRRAADAKAKGLTDVAVVETGTQRFAVSLGAFANEDNAKTRLAQVIAQGATNAKMGPRQQVIVNTTLIVRDPQATVVAKVRDLVPAYAGSDVKVGNCEKT